MAWGRGCRVQQRALRAYLRLVYIHTQRAAVLVQYNPAVHGRERPAVPVGGLDDGPGFGEQSHIGHSIA